MLPGYIAPEDISMQSHIHLGLWGGSGLVSVNEPPYKYGHINKRVPIYETAAQIVRGWSGTPAAHVLKADGTNPTIFMNYQYSLRTDYLGLDVLKHLLKKDVMFIDVLHCNDGLDHAPYTYHYYLQDVMYDNQLDPMAKAIDVNILVVDFNTVAPI